MTEPKDILYIKQPEDGFWDTSSHICIAGNSTLERFLKELQLQIDTKSEAIYSNYVWRSEGQKYDQDDYLVDSCDRWELSRYEVCPASADGTYQAVVILFYVPMVAKVPIAA